MIVLYHGTNVEFHAPDVDAGRSGMDFGKGFYLTPNLESAKFMAKRVKRLKTAGEEIVLKFAFDEKADDKLVNLLHELKRGTMSEEYVLRRLQEVEHQTMQYSIHSQDVADKFLKFVEVIHV